MLEEKNGTYSINASSVDIIMTCPRKAQYALAMNLRSEDESEALTFGKAIHAALEEFYKQIPGQRNIDAIHAAFDAAAVNLLVPAGEKRSRDNGHKIISRYCEVYANDPWMVYRDKDGPFVERSFDLPYDLAHEFPPFLIRVHGQMDAILQNTDTGEVVIVDHKTTSTVSDLLNRVKPNLQFSLYAWAANQMGIKVDRVMVNAIQVAKTKCDLLRIYTERGEHDFDELRNTLIHAVDSYRRWNDRDVFPQNSGACGNWGGCQYLDMCSAAPQDRSNIISSRYGR